MNRRRIVVRTRTGWRDVLVEERPITEPFRHRRVHEDLPPELPAKGQEGCRSRRSPFPHVPPVRLLVAG